jgi:predicted Zn-dependent protease
VARLGRVAIVSAAVIVCLWFALGARQAIDLSRATAITQGSSALSPGQARRADELLSAASTLNPDRQVDVVRGIVALARNQSSLATTILRRVTREEPMNLQGWVYLAQADLGHGGEFKHAVAQIGFLDPAPKARH